jgi:hypothetical protein
MQTTPQSSRPFAGDGFPDIAVGYGGVTMLVEIKDGSKSPSRQRLTPAEKLFHRDWAGGVMIVRDVGDVPEVVQQLKRLAWILAPVGVRP